MFILTESEAVRLLKQKAVKCDGTPWEAGRSFDLRKGQNLVISVGPSRFVKVTAE